MKVPLYTFFIIAIISFLIIADGSNYQLSAKKEQPEIRRITPVEMRNMQADALENTKKSNPELYQQIVKDMQSPKVHSPEYLGMKTNFTVYNVEDDDYYQVSATLRAAGDYCQIWVEDDSWSNGYTTQENVDSILANLEEYTAAASIDPTKGIYEIDTEYFGEPPNVDGDGMVDFLVLDIQDGWEGEGGFIAGFFFSGDQSGYNNRDMLYLDSYPGIYYNGSYNIDPIMSTTAHELQHLIHYNYDKNEETWLNEAMSQLAGTLCGYGLDNPGRFLANTNLSVTGWAENDDPVVLDHYSKVNLWAEYLLEQFGLVFITNITRSSLNGVSSINAVLSDLGIAETFQSTYLDWIICNYINDQEINVKWGYTHNEAQGIRAVANNVTAYPYNVSDQVKQYGAFYYKYFEGDSLSLTFNSSSAFARIIKYADDQVTVENLNNGIEYTDNEFNDFVQKEVLLVGSYTTSSFSIESNASSEFYIAELSHDDGEPDPFNGSAAYLGTGTGAGGYGWAVKYNVPAGSDNRLLGIKFNVGLDEGNGDVNVHIWEPSGSFPGNDMVSPVQTTLIEGWNEVDVLQLFGEEVAVSGDFFIGFTHVDDNTAVYVAMDDSEPQNYTWLIRPNGQHEKLNELGSNDYEGFNMMFRAVVRIKGQAPVEPDLNAYVLKQNYPNPFNPLTFIEFELKSPGIVDLNIYNVLGQKIRTLIDQEIINTLSKTVEWDGKDDQGYQVSSGIYFYRLTCRGFSETKKMVFLK